MLACLSWGPRRVRFHRENKMLCVYFEDVYGDILDTAKVAVRTVQHMLYHYIHVQCVVHEGSTLEKNRSSWARISAHGGPPHSVV